MTITPAQIDLWLNAPSETQNLEFKEAKSAYAFDKLVDYCVALANEGGGFFVLGVSDARPRRVVGSTAFGNILKVADDIFRTVGFRVDVHDVTHPEGRVVVFQIPSRPRGSAYNHAGKYLMRSGSSLTHMSEDRLRTIFAEGAPDWLEEAILPAVSAQDVIESLDTQTFFELLRQPFPTNQTAVIDRLVAERLVDKKPDGYVIRRIGALLLARRLERFPDVARKAARVIVYNGNSKLNTKLDQVGGRGYAVGFRGLVDFVMAQLPQNQAIVDALRTDVKLVPEDTIRELLANALIHQDMKITGASPMVEIYDDRVEISNPGEPIVPVERFIDGYQSRNERLADLMRRMNICEEKSSGIDRVVTTAEFYQLPAPDFRAGQNRTIVILYGPKSFEDMGRDDRIRACYQHCALKWVIAERMTNQSLRERFGLPESKSALTSQVITAAIQAGVIKPDESVGGSRKYARYIPFWA